MASQLQSNSTAERIVRIDRPKVGLMAGWGRYPVVVAEALRREGYRTHCLGVEGHADPALAELCDDFHWIGLAQLGHAIRYFRRHEVRDVTMVGKVQKSLLFQPWVWLKHLPDWRAVRRFYPHFLLGRKDRKDDTLLGAVVEEFARDGIRFSPATDFLPQLLVKPGPIGRRGLSGWQRRDVEFGWNIAKQLGRLDVGQSVAVKNRAALAVEAIEGTDECIRRAGTHCRAGGFTVVKVAKPQQDMRFDVPTIGIGTLRTMVAAGAGALAVEAYRTVILDQPHVAQYADQHRLVVVAIDAGEISAGQPAKIPETH